MSEPGELGRDQSYLEKIKQGRQSSAVLKASLITLRSRVQDNYIFVLEGDDDKVIYGQWIRRIRPNLRYEPFPCGGKRQLRQLRNALSQDLTGLSSNVFFFVDKDFDSLSGFCTTEAVFVTDTHSIENYIVTKEVLEDLLRDEFPCHARPDVRECISKVFEQDYSDFLRVTREVNKRLFLASQLQIELTKTLPRNLRSLAKVEIQNVTQAATPAENVVVYKREPTDSEVRTLVPVFNNLQPERHYRGKFALKFFREWLERLADEFNSGDLGLFGYPKSVGEVRRAEFVLSNFASKSRIPLDLHAFVNSM